MTRLVPGGRMRLVPEVATVSMFGGLTGSMSEGEDLMRVAANRWLTGSIGADYAAMLDAAPNAGLVSREMVERVARALATELGLKYDEMPEMVTYRERKARPDDGRPLDKAEMRVLAEYAIAALGLTVDPAADTAREREGGKDAHE